MSNADREKMVRKINAMQSAVWKITVSCLLMELIVIKVLSKFGHPFASN